MKIDKPIFMYQLDKTSRKYICPKCGRKTFVRYVDAYGQHLDPAVGKCDRKDNCNWHYPPRDFFKDHASLYSLLADKGVFDRKNNVVEFFRPSYVDPKLVGASMKEYDRNPLMRFVHSRFDSLLDPAEIDEIAMEMGVGTSKEFRGSTIFWQVDHYNHVRTGKIMGYYPNTGRRIKYPSQIKWVHTKLRENNPDFQFRQCYFGAHMIREAEKHYRSNCLQPNPLIWLFESEKAALIMAVTLAWLGLKHRYVPMACGGCDGLSTTDEKKRDPYSALQVLKGRDVVLYPDEGKYSVWKEKAMALKGFCREVYLSEVAEDFHSYPLSFKALKGEGFDDIVLRYLENGHPNWVYEAVITSYWKPLIS